MTLSPNVLKATLLFVLAAGVVGCGGGGSTQSAPTAPSGLTYSAATISAELNQPIAADTATVSGTVTSYSVSPALPAGLAMSATTGTISGTPTADAAMAIYTVTATNTAGSTTAMVKISVATPVVAPTGLTYPQTSISATVGEAIAVDTPTVTGMVSGYVVSPALPAGLTLDATTGAISGTPTAVTASAAHTVTASNSAGSTTAAVQITVVAAPVQAPSGLTYPVTTIIAYIGQAIAFDTPTVTGVVTGYAVSPALPVGLTLDAATGAITGTPTAVVGSTTYTVAASNAGGSTTATVAIEVDALPAAPTAVMYPQSTITTYVGQSITPSLPATTGGPISAYAVSPALPAGMAIDAVTGVISGSPTAQAAQANYMVTASNAAGSTTYGVSIAVNPAPIVLLGADVQLYGSVLQFANSNIFVEDDSGVWQLRNYASGTVLASGDAAHGGIALNGGDSEYVPAAQMAGSTLAIQVPGGIEVRSSADGHVLGVTVSPGYVIAAGALSETDTWQVASDGSYIALETAAGLYAYAPSGQLLFSKPGNYLQPTGTGLPSAVFAAVGQIQVAGGPANASAVETISVPSGTSAVGAAYQGTFYTWFADGSHLASSNAPAFSSSESTVWVYSIPGVQEAALPLTGWGQMGGWGNLIWVGISEGNQFAVSVYAIGSASPVVTDTSPISGIVASGSTIALFPQASGSIGIIDMAAATPVEKEYALPNSADYTYEFQNISVPYAAASGSEWVAILDTVIGDTDYFVSDEFSQVVVDGASLATATPRYFGQGPVNGMAGSANTVAIATGTQVSWFNPTSPTPLGSVSLTSGQIALSSDGTLLAAAGANNTAVNLYSTDFGALSDSLSYPTGSSNSFGFGLSGDGSVLAATIGEYDRGTGASTYTVQTSATSGGATVWSKNYTQTLDLPTVVSPDGTLVAVTEEASQGTEVLIYKNGALQATVSGSGMGWLDNGHLLAQGATNSKATTGTVIYSPTGSVLSTPPLPQLDSVQVVNSTTVYSQDVNAMYSVTTGKQTWTSPYAADGDTTYYVAGAVAGSYVVFESEGKVIAVQWQ